MLEVVGQFNVHLGWAQGVNKAFGLSLGWTDLRLEL